MVIKFDLEKAYDSFSWEFIEDTLQAIKVLGQVWIALQHLQCRFYGMEKLPKRSLWVEV